MSNENSKENLNSENLNKSVELADPSIEHKDVVDENKETFLTNVKNEEFLAAKLETETKNIAATHKPKKKVPFAFKEEEIKTYPLWIQNIIKIKKLQHEGNPEARDLQRGAERKVWKTVFVIKMDIPAQWWVAIDYGREGFKCKLCGGHKTIGAIAHWVDRYKDRETGKMVSTNFIINKICLDCLRDVGAHYMTYAEFIDIMLVNADKVRISSLHDAKDRECMFCNSMSSDCTWVTLEYGGYIMAAAVCDHDLDQLLKQSKVMDGMSDLKTDDQDYNKFNPYLQHQMKSFKGIKNRFEKAKKIKSEPIKPVKEKLTDEDFRLESEGE